MKLEIDIYKEKRDINILIRNGMFCQHNVVPIGKSVSLTVSRTISKFLKEHGFIDLIVHRKNLKEKLSQLLRMIKS